MKAPIRLHTVLYLPASNARAIEKSRTLPADAIVFDLEDSVAPGTKQLARDQLSSAFAQRDFGGSITAIRTNPINSADYVRDLDTIADCEPDAVVLPKVSTVADLETFEADAINRGFKTSCKTWYMIETVAGQINLPQLIQSGLQSRYKIDCLIVGHNDLALDAGVSLVGGRQFLVPWLMQLILHGAHAGIAVLDSVYNNFRDLDGFALEAEQAKAMGFTGKTLIHPSQVEICNTIFSPSETELQEAQEIIAAFSLPENSTVGVTSLNGKMVERLHLEQAQALVSLYS